MTIKDLIDFCKANDIDLNTHIALRAKDDYLLVARNICLDVPYFGNCQAGGDLINQIGERDADGDIDYDNIPDFLILDTGRG